MTQTSATLQRREVVDDNNAIRPVRVDVPEEALAELRRRIVATRSPERVTTHLNAFQAQPHDHQGVTMRLFFRSVALLTVALFASSAFSQTFPPGVTPVGGAVVGVTSTEVNLQTQQGPVTVHLVQPAAVYAGQPSDLKHITTNSYIGVGSVKGADGKEHATDIKIFPEVFRGLAEGSYMQPGQDGAPSNSRMTNGAVASSSKPKTGSRMTNGAVTNTGSGSELTVGNQQIEVPAGTPVILIAKTAQPLQPGQHVLIPAKKQGDGSFSAQNIFLLPAK